MKAAQILSLMLALILVFIILQTTTGKNIESLPTYKVFITNATFDANLMDPPGRADVLCQQAAINAGLGGTYIAWLSTSYIDAQVKIPNARYVRIDGKTIARNKRELMSGVLQNPITINEFGRNIQKINTWNGSPTLIDTRVYTGTLVNGNSANETCNNWYGRGRAHNYFINGILGDGLSRIRSWTELATNPCENTGKKRLYCFQTTARVRCSSDTDCPVLNNYHCEDDPSFGSVACNYWGSYRCINPGTPQSQCINITLQFYPSCTVCKLEYPPATCSNGHCVVR